MFNYITLIPEERKLVEFIAKMRTARHNKANSKSTKTFGGDQYKNDLTGFAAEFAFCKMTNTFPDFNTVVRRAGMDCTLPSGIRVDVKGTSSDKSWLKVTVGNEDQADIFVLMFVDYPRIRFLGYYPSEYLREEDVYPTKYIDRNGDEKEFMQYAIKRDRLYQVAQTEHFTQSDLA